MSNYRRLISYIYAYEGGIKGKNVGFAKLEVRNGQCKIQVNVRNIYIGNQDTGVYLLSGSKEILIGKIFIRNGAGEFRAVVGVGNVAGSGQTIDQCYGLTVHNLSDSWQSYTTIWEDAVAQAAEVALENATSERMEKEEPVRSSVAEDVEKEIEAQNRKEEPIPPSMIPSMEETEEQNPFQPVEMGVMEIRPMEVLPIGKGETAEELSGDTAQKNRETVPEETQKESPIVQETEKKTPAPAQEEPESPDNGETVSGVEIPLPSQEEPSPIQQPARQQEIQDNSQGQPMRQSQWTQPGMLFAPNRFGRANRPVRIGQQPVQPENGRPTASTGTAQPDVQAQTGGPSGAVLQQQNPLEDEPKIDSVWQRFYKTYPKIQAFDYNGGCEILTIKPQDIGLLPRETWGYGNNSFLLHGYYNHRYLIFARLNNPKGHPRFLLGVPGHYYSNEKYMAAMFGFPNFVLSKVQPTGDDRFGYWYTDIRLGF